MIPCLNALNIDVCAAGNHDFDAGFDTVRDIFICQLDWSASSPTHLATFDQTRLDRCFFIDDF